MLQQKPWMLTLRAAKAKSWDLRFKASRKLLPSLCKFFSFSIHFNLHPYLLQIKCKPQSPTFSWKSKFLKLKFLQFFKNFQRYKRVKNKGIVRSSWCGPHKNDCYGRRRKGCICLWVLLFATVGCGSIIQLSYYFGEGSSVWKYLWKAWSYAAPSGFLYEFAKVIFYGVARALGA
ncbi:hypothetical protein BUALT_Bualt09G0136100 [Buddleja alternifolia]|uniref:Uncharacterized protein n=1 Tax=Buddleja alternifolia TaxID=168488 RepID=A0AAV6X903_9LAMI|nr:hypothetical protein BUALT_Bualt09G0136100 [Buddleja alternifolia]